MTDLEQKLLNLVDALVDAGANLVAAKNPSYEPLIVLASTTADQINAQVNPSAPAAAGAIAQAAATISGDVAPTQEAIATVASSTATPTQKAGALGIILGDIEGLVSTIKNLF